MSIGSEKEPPSTGRTAIVRVGDAARSAFRFMNGTGGELRDKTVRSGAWVALSSVAATVLSLARSVILARLLAPDAFGLMSLALIVVRGVEIFTQTGFGAALIQTRRKFEEMRDTAFTLLVGRGLVLCVIVLLTAPYVAKFYEAEQLTALIQVLAITFAVTGFQNINIVVFQRELNFKRLVYMEQAVALLGFVVIVLSAYLLRSVWALAIGYVATAALSMTLSYVVVRDRPRFAFNFEVARDLFHYGKYITAVAIVIYITTEIDNLVIGKVLGTTALGYYFLAYTLANLPTTHFSKIISRVMFPAYSRLQNDLAALRRAYLRVFEVVAMVAVPAAVGMIVLAADIVTVVYGPNWAPATVALQILGVFGCIRALSSLSGYVYNAIGQPRIPFYLNLGKLAVIMAVVYPATVEFGIAGTAAAVTIPIFLEFFVGVVLLTRTIALRAGDLMRVLYQIVLPSAVMGMIVFLVRQTQGPAGIWLLLVLVLLGVVVYSALCRRRIKDHLAWIRQARGLGSAESVGGKE